MPRWLSGLGYVLGLLDRWFDSLFIFFTFFCNTTTIVLRYWRLFVFFAAEQHHDIATYAVYDSVADLKLSKNSLLASDRRSEPITVQIF